MGRIDNGIIAFVMDSLPSGSRLMSITVTNTFPIIPLGEQPILLHAGLAEEKLDKFEHLSLPSDLRLHITGPKEHIFFDVADVWKSLDEKEVPAVHMFTHIGLPYRRLQPFVGPGETKTWHEAAIVSPFRDVKFTDLTRLYIDFFVHTLEANAQTMAAYPFLMQNMRLAADRSGSLFGPFTFESVQRKSKPSRSDLMFSIRFGYVDIADNDSTYSYSPHGIFDRRKRG